MDHQQESENMKTLPNFNNNNIKNNNANNNTEQEIYEEHFDVKRDVQEVVEEVGEPMEEDDDENMMDTNDDAAVGEDSEQAIYFEDDSVQGFFDHKEPVYCIAIHPTIENIIVTGGGDDQAMLWRKDTGEKIAQLLKHEDSVVAVGFSFDGMYVASGGMDGKVHVFKGVSGQHLVSLEGPSEVMWLDWHPKGYVLLAGSADGTMWMWSIPTGSCMNVFSAHSDSVHFGKFTNSGKQIVSASEDGSIIVWDPKTATVMKKFSQGIGKFHEGPVYVLDVRQDDQMVLTGSEDGTARLLHIANGQVMSVFDHKEENVEAVAFSKTQYPAVCATGDVNANIHVWDANNYKLRHTLKHDDAITKLVFHEFTLFSSSTDKTVRAWDIKTGTCLKVWRGHQDNILDFVVSHDGRQVITAGDDGVSLVFEL